LVAPDNVAYVPLTHRVHFVWASFTLYLPAGHAVHELSPEREKKPIAQKVQLEDPELLWYFPPAHSVHVLEATLAE